MSAARHFSQSYAEARARFLEAAEAAGLDVESHRHPMLGRDGETLAMDVVRDGPKDAPALLMTSRAAASRGPSRATSMARVSPSRPLSGCS